MKTKGMAIFGYSPKRCIASRENTSEPKFENFKSGPFAHNEPSRALFGVASVRVDEEIVLF